MQYRNFIDVNPIIFDNQGNKLYGVLVFLEADSTNPKNVVDVDHQNLGNIIATNSYGKLAQQIILQEGDYDVEYWKYVGTQFDYSTDESLEENFSLIRTERIVEHKMEISVEGLQSVETMDDLVALETHNDDEYIMLEGYYEVGDAPLVYYHYDANSSATANNFSVVKPSNVTSNGRWLMVIPDVVNVLNAGVKAFSSTSSAEYYSSRLSTAITYANRYDRKVYFPSVYESRVSAVTTYYGFDGGSYIIHNLKVDDNVIFYPKETTTTTFNIGNLEHNDTYGLFYNANRWTVTADTLSTNELHNASNATLNKYIYRTTSVQGIPANTTIHFSVQPTLALAFNGNKLEFDNGIYLKKTLSNVFQNMTIDDNIWGVLVDFSTNSQVFTNCTSNFLEKWLIKQNWFDFNYYKLNVSDFDLGGSYITSIYPSRSITLGNGSVGTLSDASTASSSSLSYTLSNVNVGSVHFYNISGTTTLINATIGSGTMESGTMNMMKCIATCSTMKATNFTASNSTLTGAITTNKPYLTDCTISGNVNFNFKDSSNQFQILNNTFLGESHIIIQRESGYTSLSNALMNGFICNNQSYSSTFCIEINREGMDANDTNHTYKYEKNGGSGFTMNKDVKSVPFKVLTGSPSQDIYYDAFAYLIRWDSNSKGEVCFNGKVFEFDMFTFGTTNVTADIDIEYLGVDRGDSTITTRNYRTHHSNFFPSMTRWKKVLNYPNDYRISTISGSQVYVRCISMESSYMTSGYRWGMNLGYYNHGYICNGIYSMTPYEALQYADGDWQPYYDAETQQPAYYPLKFAVSAKRWDMTET